MTVKRYQLHPAGGEHSIIGRAGKMIGVYEDFELRAELYGVLVEKPTCVGIAADKLFHKRDIPHYQ